jgi:hypothetical protein
MKNVAPSNCYDLLDPAEQAAVNDYVLLLTGECQRRGGRIANVLGQPIPSELVRRSRGVLERPMVRAAIHEALTDAAQRQDVSPARVVREHAALAFSNIADFIEFGLFGEIIFNFRGRSREQMAAIKQIKIDDTPTGRSMTFTMHDKQPSLKSLQEIMTMPTIADAAPRSTKKLTKDDDAEKAYAALLESMRVPT